MTLADIATRLQRQLDRDATHLSAALVDVAPLDWFLREMLSDAAITYSARPAVTLDAAQQQLEIRGTCAYLTYVDVDLTITLQQTSADITVQADAVLSAGSIFRLPGLSWFAVADLHTRLASGRSWNREAGDDAMLQPVPIVNAAFHGNIHLPAGIAIPVRMETLVGAADQWLLSLDTEESFTLPDAPALAGLIGEFKPDEILPAPAKDFLSHIQLQRFAVGWDTREKLVTGVSVTLADRGEPWAIMPGHLSVRTPRLTLAVQNPTDADNRVFRAIVSGTIELALSTGKLDVPVEVAVSTTDLSLRLGGSQPIKLPSLSDVTAVMFGAGVAQALPPQFEVSGFSVDEFYTSYSVAAGTLSKGELELHADEWPIVPGYLSVRELALRVEVDSPLKQPAVRAGLAGIIVIGGTDVPVAVVRSDQGDWAFSIVQVTLPSIADVLRTFGGDAVAAALPGVDRLGSVTLNELSLAFSGSDHAVTAITARISGLERWQPIASVDALVIEGVSVALTVSRNERGDLRKLDGTITGSATVLGATTGLTARIGDDLTLTFHLECLQLSKLVQILLGANTPLPIVADVVIKTLTVTATPARNYLEVVSTASAFGDVPLGGDVKITFEKIDFTYKRVDADVTCGISTSGHCSFAQGLAIEAFSFDFGHDARGWSFRSNVDVTMFGAKEQFDVEYTEKDGEQKLAISLHADPAWPVIATALSVSSVTLDVTRAKAGITWNFTAGATLVLPGFKEIIGEIKVSQAQLEFNSDAEFSVPIVPKYGVELKTWFKGVTFKWSPDWMVECRTELTLIGLPSYLYENGILPASTPVTLSAGRTNGKTSVEITAGELAALEDFTIPDLVLGEPGSADAVTIPLSQFSGASIVVKNLHIVIGAEVSVTVVVVLGLPANINELFGTKVVDGKKVPKLVVFSTAPIDIEFGLGYLGEKGWGIQFGMDTPPILPQFLKADTNNKTWDVDFGEYGAVSMQVPSFLYNGTSFSTDGKVTVTRDLNLPLKPLRLLLGQLMGSQDRARQMLPDMLPIRSVSLHDVLEDLKQAIGPKHPDIDAAIDQIEHAVERLPDRLQDYLAFDPPREFGWHINLRADASVELGFTTDVNHPIRLLLPMPPMLCGFTFRGLSFGPLLGGSLFQLKLDCDFDQFDLLSIALGLALGDNPQFPIARNFHRSLIVDQLFMIIVYETVLPIPIPVFFNQLGIEYLGVEGLELQAHAALPQPELDPADLARSFMQLKRFASDPEYHLQNSDLPEKSLPHFSLSRCFAQLPAYISPNAYVGDKEQDFFPQHSLADHIVNLLNTVKFISINDVIQLIPLEYRTGAYFLSGQDGPHPVLGFLGLVSADCVWLLTTPYEFVKQKAYARIGLEVAEANHLLATLPGALTADTPGIVLFFKTSIAVGKLAGVNVRLGLVSVKGAGFATSFRVDGYIGELRLTLEGSLETNQAQKRMDAAGAANLLAGDWPLFTGHFNAHTSQDGFAIHGDVALLPPEFPIHAGETLDGTVNGATGVSIQGAVQADLSVVTLAGASVDISGDHVALEGQFLGRSLKLLYERTDDDFVLRSEAGILAINMVVTQTCLRKDSSVTTLFHADIVVTMAFDAVFLLPASDTNKATLTMFGVVIFYGSIDVSTRGFAIHGMFNVFPPESPVQFQVESHGSLDDRGLILGGGSSTTVLFVTLRTNVSIKNGLPALSGGATIWGQEVAAAYGLRMYHNVLAFCASFHADFWWGAVDSYLVVSPAEKWFSMTRPEHWPLESTTKLTARQEQVPRVEAVLHTGALEDAALIRDCVQHLLTGGVLTGWTDEETRRNLPLMVYYSIETCIRPLHENDRSSFLTEVTLQKPGAARPQDAPDIFAALRDCANAIKADPSTAPARAVIDSLNRIRFRKTDLENRMMVTLVGIGELEFAVDLASWDLTDWARRALQATASPSTPLSDGVQGN
ncbi:MAG: hypothetical protein WEE89_17260 [Gemmatimonadota bacterium]